VGIWPTKKRSKPIKSKIEITMNKDISLSKAAIIAGVGLLIMTLTVPFAEFKIIRI